MDCPLCRHAVAAHDPAEAGGCQAFAEVVDDPTTDYIEVSGPCGCTAVLAGRN